MSEFCDYRGRTKSNLGKSEGMACKVQLKQLVDCDRKGRQCFRTDKVLSYTLYQLFFIIIIHYIYNTFMSCFYIH